MIEASVVLDWMKLSFDVDAERGILIWKNPPKNHPRLLGTEAGSLRPNVSGKLYCIVKMDRVAQKRGRLIYLWVNGRWPVPCIDHQNGDSTNDASSNLREATVMQNAWNHKKRARRIKLPMGVRTTAAGRFEARIGFNNQQLHLGAFDAPEEAHAVYLQKRKELYGQFA